jgi:hypothetical protein
LEWPGATKPSSENSVAPTPSKVPVMYTAYTWVGINAPKLKARSFLVLLFPSPTFVLLIYPTLLLVLTTLCWHGTLFFHAIFSPLFAHMPKPLWHMAHLRYSSMRKTPLMCMSTFQLHAKTKISRSQRLSLFTS